MNLRFECRDAKQQQLHVFRVEMDGRSTTLYRLRSGLGKEGEERWDTWGYYTDLPNAVHALMLRGIGTFPGTVVEVLKTIEQLRDEIHRVLAPFARVGPSLQGLRTAALAVDPRLKAETVAEPETKRGETEPEIDFDDI